jgi:hypothetical protein
MYYSVISCIFDGLDNSGEFFEVRTNKGNVIVVFSEEEKLREFFSYVSDSAKNEPWRAEIVRIEASEVPRLAERTRALSPSNKVIMDTDPLFDLLLQHYRARKEP